MPTLYQNQFDHNVITKELEQAWVDEDAPRVPAVPYPYEFETYSVVWYWSHDGKWYPALVLGPAKDTPDQLLGLIKDWNPRDRNEKMHVYLCPSRGNAKPDDAYTRLLLKLYKKIPDDDCHIQKMVDDFRNVIFLNM
ncbi:hypothetical protein ACEPAH_69 [Sanghuangporus vaninii]